MESRMACSASSLTHGRRAAALRAAWSSSSPVATSACCAWDGVACASPRAASQGPPPSPPPGPAPADEEDDRVFLVPRRWWKEAQEGAGIEAAELPYAAAPAGSTSYGMRVLSIFISDQAYTLRRTDELLQQQAAPGASQAPRRGTEFNVLCVFGFSPQLMESRKEDG